MIPSPCYQSRGNTKVIWVVIHTAEGARTATELGNYFANPANQVSSHVGIDDSQVIQYVDYSQASWTLRNGNNRSDNAELCGFAAWTRDQWLNQHRNMLVLAAQWIRERCQARGVPMVHLTPADVAAGRPGVIGHWDYTRGTGDGSHVDPGQNFPWDVVMQLAAGPTPAPAPPKPIRTEEDEMFLVMGAGSPPARMGLLSGGIFRELTAGERQTAQDTIVRQGADQLYVEQATWDWWLQATAKQLGA